MSTYFFCYYLFLTYTFHCRRRKPSAKVRQNEQEDEVLRPAPSPTKCLYIRSCFNTYVLTYCYGRRKLSTKAQDIVESNRYVHYFSTCNLCHANATYIATKVSLKMKTLKVVRSSGILLIMMFLMPRVKARIVL
jgi:hypothetical protein